MWVPGKKGSVGGHLSLPPRSLAAHRAGPPSLPLGVRVHSLWGAVQDLAASVPALQLITQITKLQLPGTSPEGQGNGQRPLGVLQAPSPSRPQEPRWGLGAAMAWPSLSSPFSSWCVFQGQYISAEE